MIEITHRNGAVRYDDRDPEVIANDVMRAAGYISWRLTVARITLQSHLDADRYTRWIPLLFGMVIGYLWGVSS